MECAIAGGNIEIIHIIENEIHDAEITKNINFLYIAILYFKNELIDYIIDTYEYQIDAESYIKCIYASNYVALEKLINMDESNAINEYGEIASFEGYLTFFKYLVKNDHVKYKIKNKFGKNILQSAARSNKVQIVKYIIENHLLNKFDRGKYKFMPYQIAKFKGSLEVVEYYQSIKNKDI